MIAISNLLFFSDPLALTSCDNCTYFKKNAGATSRGRRGMQSCMTGHGAVALSFIGAGCT